MKRNVIVTVAADYALTTLEPFLASFAERVETAELIVIARNCDDAFYRAAAAMGVIVIEATPRRPYAVMGSRHFMYRDVLRANRRNFDEVLITDCRDVVFQSDPFRVARDRPVWLAAEDETIGACPMNTLWLTWIYGGAVIDALAPHRISCAGTTIGTLDGVLRYLDLMCNELDAHAERIHQNGDQGFHNYILHRLKPDFVRLDEDDRVMKTLGYTADERIAVTGGEVLVDGAATAPVLHQWDRKAAVGEFVRRRYRLDRGAVAAAA